MSSKTKIPTKSRFKKMSKKATINFFVHPTAIVEDNVVIGQNSKIWHFAQVRTGTKIGKNCIIANSVFIDNDSEIGNNVKIQNHAIIYHKAIIEDGVFIGPNVCFTNDKIPRAINPDGSIKGTDDWKKSAIIIGKGASIGGHSVILPGVTIGAFSMAGSGSVITKDVPEFTLVFGNPARIKGFICKCGQKIKKFVSRKDHMEGKCACGLDITISKNIYKEVITGKDKTSKRVWIR